MKRLVIWIIAMTVMLSLAGCGKKEVENKELTMVAPAGSPVISTVKLMEEEKPLGENMKLTIEPLTSVEVLKNKIIAEEVDLAVVPTNMAAILYNKNVPYQIVGTSIWGNLYLVSDHPIDNVEDLKNEKIHVFGQGLTPDLILKYILGEKGLDVKALDLNYIPNATEIAPLFITGKAKVALIPEPMLSAVKMKKEEIYSVLDLQQEWAAIHGNAYPQASVIAKKSLVEEDSEAIKAFMKAYQESVTWINENPEEAGALAEALEMGYKKPLIAKAIPGSNMDVKEVADIKEDIVAYYKVLEGFTPKTLGGKIPDEGIFADQ